VGPFQDGPGDAAVLRPKLSTDRGIAIGAGLQPGIGEKAAPDFAEDGDSYWMALACIDEAVRNVVCVGADPKRIAFLDNFCWPSCDDPEQLGSLVRAAEACYDGALAYHAPFVSGKDSLNNQFTTENGRLITIPPTLLITSLGIVPDVCCCRTMEAKATGNVLLIVGQTTSALGGSHYVRVSNDRSGDMRIPRVDLKSAPHTAAAVANLIARGLVRSTHDCSDGGLLTATAEMAFAGRIGLDLDLSDLPVAKSFDAVAACFAETPGRYLLEVEKVELAKIKRTLSDKSVPHAVIGTFAGHDRLTVQNAGGNHLLDATLDTLRDAWHRPLDW
jgi:phosphoribosylformylglycinamidine synthase